NLERMRDRIAAIRAEPAPDLSSRTQAALAMVRELKRSEDEEGEAEKHGFIYRFHPSLSQRIIQLKQMGADVVWNDRRDYSDLIDGIFVGGFLLIVAIIIAIASQSQ
ncbi:MAG TPA: hypothetical protein VIS99_11545, partial [Terrimicrobiaceae bacterium]